MTRTGVTSGCRSQLLTFHPPSLHPGRLGHRRAADGTMSRYNMAPKPIRAQHAIEAVKRDIRV